MTNLVNMQEIQELFELGAHMGHKKSRLHPKAKKNVYKMVNGTSIIDLTKTVGQLKTAKDYLTKAAKDEKVILVVGTKKVASSFIREFCSENTIPFISSKWLPGLLTNFETLMKNVHKLTDLKEKEKSEEWETIIKHERTQMQKEMSKLERLYGGLVAIKKRPDILVVIDARKEKNAVGEAIAYKIPIVALIDTNSNPERIDYPILANDDAAGVVEKIMTELLNPFIKTKKEVKKETTKKEQAAEATA